MIAVNLVMYHATTSKLRDFRIAENAEFPNLFEHTTTLPMYLVSAFCKHQYRSYLNTNEILQKRASELNIMPCVVIAFVMMCPDLHCQ